MANDPVIITPERLGALEEEAHRAMQRAWAAGLTADGTVAMLCAALRLAWQEHDTARAAAIADAVALRGAVVHARRALELAHDEDALRDHLDRVLTLNTGAALLAELEVARVVARAVLSFMHGRGTIAAVRAAGESYHAFLIREAAREK